MSDDYVDPSGSTEQFRAFVNSDQATAASARGGNKTGLIVAGVVVAAVVVALLAWLALS